MSKFIIQPGDGNLMASLALVHANTGVVAAYQITPSTQVSENLLEMKRTGVFKGIVRVMNGEDDAFTACVAASLCGARTAGPSCSQGLIYGAQPILYMSGARLPIVIPIANRAVSAPVNIHPDHSDAMFFRDAGMIMLFAKNAQEVYDYLLLAFKIAEYCGLPVSVNYEGFEISHTTVINKVLNDKGVDELLEYIGKYYHRPTSMFNMEHPHASGGLILPNNTMEVKYSVLQAMLGADTIISEATDFYSEHFWPVHSFVEGFELEDAEYAVVVMGSRFGTVKEAVRKARASGKKAGALRIVSFRPFPVAKVREMLGGKIAVAVLDRSGVFGAPMAPLCESVVGSLLNSKNMPLVRNLVDSLGGRAISVKEVSEILDSLEHPEKWEKDIRPTYVGVRGGDTI